MNATDKKPLESKKFVFGLLTVIGLLGVIVVALITQTFGWPMVAFMVMSVAGLVTIAMGYVLGQGSIDKWVNIVGRLEPLTPKGKSDDNTEGPVGQV